MLNNLMKYELQPENRNCPDQAFPDDVASRVMVEKAIC
jgi:hypothetical protein